MKSVSVIGAGRVGGAIALSLPANKYRVEHVVFRSPPSDTLRERIGPDVLLDVVALERVSSEIIFITTQDRQISDTVKSLMGKIEGAGSIYHTCGALPSSELSSLGSAERTVGSIHPLVSISDPELGPDRFRGAFFCVEGEPKAVATAEQVVKDLGGNSFTIETKFKTLYHAAAVTACGHLVALFEVAVEMMMKCGLSEEKVIEILLPLVDSTVANLHHQSIEESLTGTFARADIDTLTRHLSTLNENVSDEILEIYLLLGERSLEIAARRGVSRERLDSLRTKMAIAKTKLKW